MIKAIPPCVGCQRGIFMPYQTPIADYLRRYAESGALRLHMPGHKGKPLYGGAFAQVTAPDITEINGSDSLYEPNGIIAESERIATELFGSAATLYSAGGSTLCIQTMLALIASTNAGDLAAGSVKIIAARNVHRSFVSTCALLDLEVVWLHPDYSDATLLSGKLSPEAVGAAIAANPDAKCVYLTSPDYLGGMADIPSIAAVCRAANIPLAVDAAHGSHLRFLPIDRHAITEGADICCNSAHKSLPALTGAAYLHIADTPHGQTFLTRAKELMSMFGSTSPSYLILCSLDLCNAYLGDEGREDLQRAALHIAVQKQQLSQLGWRIEESEPLRITINAPSMGYHGVEIADILRRYGIECEYADSVHVVLLFSGYCCAADFDRLGSVMSRIPKRTRQIKLSPYTPLLLQGKMRMKQAAFSPSELLPVEQCEGRICAGVRVKCPPGVPLVVPGELVTAQAINILKSYSIFQLNVVK